MVLMQVQKLYDPLGLMTPFTLQAKLLLRLTWALKLNWDEPIPDILVQKWMRYFTLLFGIEEFQYPRSLKPDDAEGDPYLIILSDGSDWFYGFVAYIRWQLKSGGYWCRFIMSKSRIAPLTKLSTPQMELNGAVLSKRGRLVIEKECRFKFRNILQIVDSETVLCMLKKTSHRFKVYEGVRIGEVQASTSGDMSCWAWMQGSDNIADLTTRCKVPHDINPDSEWFVAPSILYSPIEQWGLKFDTSHLNDQFSPGEKKNVQSHSTEAIPVLIEYKKFSKLKTIMNIIARIIGMSNKTSFTGGRISCITSDALHKAELCLIRDIQKTISNECVKVDRKGRKGGSYAALYPVLNHDNVWVIGTRLASNPMTVYGDPQVLLPTAHWGTRLFMRYAHAECGHRGRDSTVSRFRLKFWTPQAAKLAKSVKQQCQLCKLRDHKLLSQHMGVMPLERVKLSPAWCRTMVDIFGPYSIKGEVQKRTSGKGYGVIFTDLVSRAVHIEAVYGYDTHSFLLALSRFANLRGYPSDMFSDPGSQLAGADSELKSAWKNMDQDKIKYVGAEMGMTWHFGPADASWYQGAVESLIAGVKRTFKIIMSKELRFSVSEFLTMCTEVANILNERPLGTLSGADSEVNILTPNCLLIGRAT